MKKLNELCCLTWGGGYGHPWKSRCYLLLEDEMVGMWLVLVGMQHKCSNPITKEYKRGWKRIENLETRP